MVEVLILSNQNEFCPFWLQNPMEDVVGVLWMLFQPLLFGLIGAAVKVSSLKADDVGMFVAAVVCSFNFF